MSHAQTAFGHGTASRLNPVSDPARATQAAAAGPLSRLVAWVKRIPTGWFASILTGLFLAVTAAFGGLAPVAEAAVAPLEVGEAQDGAQLSVAVERAVLFDSFPEAGAYAEEGERVLALLVTVENRWSKPLLSSHGAVEQALRLDGVTADVDGAEPSAIARLDDATFGPWLQPGVPADLVVSWVVPETSIQVGDPVSVVVREATLEIGQGLTSDERWVSPQATASVDLVVAAGGDRGGAE